MTEKLFKIVLFVLSLMSVFLLGFVILYIVMEALPVFKEVSIRDFLFSSNWNPTGVVGIKALGYSTFWRQVFWYRSLQCLYQCGCQLDVQYIWHL